MPVVLLPMLAFILVAAVPAVKALRRTPAAAGAREMPVHDADLADIGRMLALAYEEERTLMHRQAVEWLNSLGRGPLRVTDATPAPGARGCESITLVDGTVLNLSHTGHAVREIVHCLDRFADVALTRVRAARDGFELTFEVEGGEPVQARAELLTVRGALI